MTRNFGNWSMGLIHEMGIVNNQIISTDAAVVINDKFPKAQQHYLVLPKQDIATIFTLRKEHLSLLHELHLLAQNIIEIKGGRYSDFKIGFHAEPSMQRLHLHVISTDFVSDCLKTKKHWNSFNTRLFLPYNELYKQLEQFGSIKRLDKMEIKQLESNELACNQCDFVAKNMPSLKDHLYEHWTERQNNARSDR